MPGFAENVKFDVLHALSDKKEFSNMTSSEMQDLEIAKEYDIIYDYSEADINGFNYMEFCEYYKPKSGLPARLLLNRFETTMVRNLNNGIKDYKFNHGEQNDSNRFSIIVKFSTITAHAKSIGYIVAMSKESGNIAFRKFSTKAGRWNDFEVLLMEDAESPFVNAPDKYSIQFVSQAIENATYFFRKNGHKLIRKK